MSSNIIRIGDKVDIRVRQQAGKEATAPELKVYFSKVLNTRDNGSIEVTVPMENEEPVLLPMNVRIEFWFYTSHGVYRCMAHIKDRYRKQGQRIFLLEPKTRLEKYQRRQFYRLECLIDLQYLPVTEEELQLEDAAEIRQKHKADFPEDLPKEGVAVDLSGGGMRFMGYTETEAGRFLWVSIRLKNESVDYTMELIGKIVSCKRIEGGSSKKRYEYRVKFKVKSQKEQEKIVKYIFEQERINRQRQV